MNSLSLCIFVFSNQINILNIIIFQHYRGQVLIMDDILVGISVLSDNPTKGLYYVYTQAIIPCIIEVIADIQSYAPRSK